MGFQPFYHVKHSLDFKEPVEKVFGHWTSFDGFPRFLEGVESVRRMGPSRYVFQLHGPDGRTMIWDAVIARLVPNQYLEWGSDSQSPIQCSGRARFRERPGATRVDVEIEYGPAAGWTGSAANRFLERSLPGYLAKGSRTMDDAMETANPA
ncbi:MAG TPA: SRPBCC family protein [Fibrobacteria bacterium]|nr:SRPBCC family protein [Fibrobacteria bacterium]